MTINSPLILASASPRRVELLRAAGFTFAIRPANVDETLLPGETAAAATVRLAVAKARAAHRPGNVTLGADTLGQFGPRVLGKPRDRTAARELLLQLASDTHEIVTGWCVRTDADEVTGLASARVTFRLLSFYEVEEYCALNPVTDYAAGYAIQGLAGSWVTQLIGTRETVIGLPVAEVAAQLRQFEGRPKAA